MSPASPAAVAASLRQMGCLSIHADRLIAGRPLVSISPTVANVALARGPRMRVPHLRTGPVPLPDIGCWWSTTNKALVAEIIATGQGTIEAICTRYDVDRKEVEEWVRAAVNASQDHYKTARLEAAE